MFHEIWHIGFDNLLRLGALPEASALAASDRARALEWLGISDIDQNKNLSELSDEEMERLSAAHEKWAEGGEKYLATGIAPDKSLQGLFDRIKNWMIGVIDGAVREMELPKDIADIYGRMLAVPVQSPTFDANTSIA